MKSAGVGGGGGGGGRSEREDTGGQLLKELEALSQALYNAGGQRQQHAGPPAPSRMESWSSGSSSRSDEEPPQSPYNLGPGSRRREGYALLQPWHSQGFERNLPEVTNFPAWLEDNVKFSQKLEAPPKEKKGFWNWKPFRAIARIAQQRFHCVFTMHVHGIEGLPATMNGLRLSVSWKRKEAMTQTVPSRVFQGSAEFEETLSLKSTIYGSKSGAGDIKYEPKNFDLAVIALDIDSLVLGTHRLDLTRLLPANPEKNSTTLDDEEKRWMTSFNLAGKAKGGTLVVTFGYQLLLRKDSQQLLSSSLLSSSSNSSPKEEPLTRQDSSEEAGNGVGAAAALELLDHVEEEDRDREIPGIDDGEMQELLDVMDAHGEECGKGDERSRNVEFFLIQENENENNVARITRHQDCMQSPISILQEETTSRQGKSWAEEEEKEENDDDYDNDEMDKRDKREKSTHHKKLDETATKNREHAGLEEEEEENDDDDDDDDDDMDKREKREKSAHREKLDETATKNRERAGLDEEEEAEEEVQKAKQEAKRSIILNSDDEIDLVAGEFLNLLEKEGELSAAAGLMSSDSEADSPRAQVLKQFEQEALIEGRIGLGFNLAEDSFEHSHNGRWSSEEDLELVAIMEAAELELQKAIQMMRSKTRARALEDEETEALMNEWGLNTKVFEGSPPPTRPSKLDNYNDNSAAAALLVPPLLPMSPPPSLGRGLGPVIPVHGGGCLRSMSAVHFPGGCDEGSARLVMQVSKPLVVSSEMGSTSLDILRRMATAGMEGMAVQAMMTMPLEDITGMTVDCISSQGLAALGGNSYSQGNHRNGNALGNQAGSGLHTYTRGSDRKPNQMANSSFNPYMSLEDLAPNAMEKIEALAMEGLKIQSEMTENYAPYSVDALSWQQEREAINGGGGGGGFKVKQGGEGIEKLEGASALHLLEGGHLAVGTTSDIFNNDLMSTAISLDEWMRLDAGICDEETSKSSLATVAAHNALHQNMIVMEKDEDSGKTCNRNKGGFLGTNTLTLAMLIQLHDPLRDYEPVGAPMMALVQAERVMVPSSPRAKLGRCISQKGNSEEDEHSSVSPAPQQQQQFKIVDITVSGLKIDDNSTTTTGGGREVGWGNQRQQQSGSRWLVANGMSKSLKHQVLKTKAPPPPPSLPATPAKFKVQKGETLWSISSLIHGTGTKWQEVAALNPHIRNPDVIFANTTIRTR
ncbi:unnamed protein product [Sphagnum balticum]